MSAIYSDLAGASVLITGGGTGIGAALTEAFVRQGSKVAFIDIAEKPSVALCDMLEKDAGARPLFIKADLTDTAALRAAIAQAAKTNGPIRVLVNNAAFDERHKTEDVTPEFWDATIAVNLKHAFFAIQAVLPGMKQAGGGAIVNFTSVSFMMNTGGMPAYTSAKAGVIGLTKGLASELGPDNIRINAIMPGWIMTERQKTKWVTPEALANHMNRQCVKYELQPADMAGPCLFLASDASRSITAQVVIADGGVL